MQIKSNFYDLQTLEGNCFAPNILGPWSRGTILVHHFMGNRWGNSVRLYVFGAPKSLQMVTAAMKLKDAYSLEGKL